jgi:hypothetical protein
MTIDTSRTIFIAPSDGDIHILLPKSCSHLDVVILKLGDPAPESNDGAVYMLAAEEMEEVYLPNAY